MKGLRMKIRPRPRRIRWNPSNNRAVKLCYQPLLKQIGWFENNRKAIGCG